MLDLKCGPAMIGSLLDGVRYLPGLPHEQGALDLCAGGRLRPARRAWPPVLDSQLRAGLGPPAGALSAGDALGPHGLQKGLVVNDRLGVLGGMGPQATNTFYQFVIDRTDARTDQEHVNALILSDCQMPDRTAAILGTEEDREAVYQRLLADARLLEGAGCTVIAVPCNTSHFFLDRVQEQIGIPILHMIRETARLLAAQGRAPPGHSGHRRHHPDRVVPEGVCRRRHSGGGPHPGGPEAGHVPDL